MRCPACGTSDSRVVDTSSYPDQGEIRRRRECLSCGRRFTTVERIRSALPLVVKTSPVEGLPPRREPFSAEKLLHSIRVACAKRPISPAAIDRVVDGIEAGLEALGAEEVPSHTIGEMVLLALRELDGIAYIRYAAVFLDLRDLQAVKAEIDRLLFERTNRQNGTANR